MANHNVLILKELEKGFNTGKPLSGIVRLECESGITELSLSLINLCPPARGELFLYIFGKNNLTYTFPLPNRPCSYHKTLEELCGVCDGFAGALVLVKEDIPLTLAFGKTDGIDIALSGAKKLIAEKRLSDRRATKKEQAKPKAEQSVEPKGQAQAVQDIYNDEAVATENYFELEQELKEKINLIKEKDKNEELSNADGKATNQCQKEKEESKSRADFLSNEAYLFSGESQAEESRKPFYITAERELKTLFEKFPAYDNLKCYFPDSRWVKIDYDTDRFYIVGLIKEDGKEKYICYGVPEKYSPQPPKELKGYCTFIPLSIFDMQGDGFWMMFQDAISGECITPK